MATLKRIISRLQETKKHVAQLETDMENQFIVFKHVFGHLFRQKNSFIYIYIYSSVCLPESIYLLYTA